jgi:hypothetical protein
MTIGHKDYEYVIEDVTNTPTVTSLKRFESPHFAHL